MNRWKRQGFGIGWPSLGKCCGAYQTSQNVLSPLRLRFRPRFFRRQSTDYQQFGGRETLTISMWSTGGAGAVAGGTGAKYGL